MKVFYPILYLSSLHIRLVRKAPSLIWVYLFMLLEKLSSEYWLYETYSIKSCLLFFKEFVYYLGLLLFWIDILSSFSKCSPSSLNRLMASILTSIMLFSEISSFENFFFSSKKCLNKVFIKWRTHNVAILSLGS